MDEQYVKEQGVDICTRQIEYDTYGLKQSKDTSFLVATLVIINHLSEKYYDLSLASRQNLLSLLNNLRIKWKR